MPLSTTPCLPLCSSTWPEKSTQLCWLLSPSADDQVFNVSSPKITSTSFKRLGVCPYPLPCLLVHGWVVNDRVTVTLPHKTHSRSRGLWAHCFLYLESSFPRCLPGLLPSFQQVFTQMPPSKWDPFPPLCSVPHTHHPGTHTPQAPTALPVPFSLLVFSLALIIL